MNKYEQARYDKGLCISCGKRPYIEGNKRCNECIELLREKSKADYYFKKSHGICVKCGQEKAVEGRVKCADCLAKGYKVGDKRKDTPKYKEYQKQYNYNRYHYRKEHGLCVKCGKPMYKDSNRLCYEHYIKEKNNSVKRPMSKSEVYKENGLCLICGKPVCELGGGKFCQEHYDRKAEVMKKNREKYNGKNWKDWSMKRG